MCNTLVVGNVVVSKGLLKFNVKMDFINKWILSLVDPASFENNYLAG